MKKYVLVFVGGLLVGMLPSVLRYITETDIAESDLATSASRSVEASPGSDQQDYVTSSASEEAIYLVVEDAINVQVETRILPQLRQLIQQELVGLSTLTPSSVKSTPQGAADPEETAKVLEWRDKAQKILIDVAASGFAGEKTLDSFSDAISTLPASDQYELELQLVGLINSGEIILTD